MKLGEILVSEGILTVEDVNQALSIQSTASDKNKAYFGEVCISYGLCAEIDILNALSKQLSLRKVEDVLDEKYAGSAPGSDLADQFFNSEWWKQRQAFPLYVDEITKELYIAQLDIWDDFIHEAFKKVYGISTVPVLCSNYDLRQLLSCLEDSATNHQSSLVSHDHISAPVVKFLNECVQRAIQEKASDIHFEVNKNVFKVRFRVDGVLRTVDQPSISQHAAILSRIKLMAGLDISERRLPQDGRIRVRLSGLQVDIRVATTPTVYGENAVLRLLANEQDSTDTIRQLDMFPDQLAMIREIVSNKNGIFLVTGPTGSGKTTSLYTLLGSLNNDDTKIITVEDPVEYQMKGLTQIQVNSEIGLDFSTVLRSALRQDPDVMLIGEMRDRETAQIAIQSALTGHFVLSTLHTNDAPSSFIRLKDIGIPDYLIKSTIVGIMGQRLLRRLCGCAEIDPQGQNLADNLGWSEVERKWPNMIPESLQFKKAVGCDRCNGTGYKGRLAVYELMTWSSSYDVAIEMVELEQVVEEQKMRSLRYDALLRAAQGDTTLDELLRVIG